MEAITLVDSYNTRKRILRAAIIASLILFIGYSLTQSVGAIDSAYACYIDAADKVKQFCDSANLVELVVNKFALVSQIQSTTNAFSKSLSDIALFIAQGLVVLYVFLAIIKESIRGDPTMDFWFKVFVIVGLTCFVCAECGNITNSIDKFGSAAMKEASKISTKTYTAEEIRHECRNAPYEILLENNVLSEMNESKVKKLGKATEKYWETGDITDAAKVMRKYIKNEEYKSTVFLSLALTIMSVLKLGLICAIDAQVFFIAIQLVIRKAMVPIAVVGIASEGARSTGIRYLKRYFALYLQMAIIVVISGAFLSVLMAAFKSNATSHSFSQVYYIVTSIGALTVAIGQSGSLANELLGD